MRQPIITIIERMHHLTFRSYQRTSSIPSGTVKVNRESLVRCKVCFVAQPWITIDDFILHRENSAAPSTTTRVQAPLFLSTRHAIITNSGHIAFSKSSCSLSVCRLSLSSSAPAWHRLVIWAVRSELHAPLSLGTACPVEPHDQSV